MNKKTIIGISLVLVVLLAFGYLLHHLLSPDAAQPAQPGPGVTFPSASTTAPGGTTGVPVNLAIEVQNGQKLVTKDFIHNGVTILDPANQESYLLTGDLGECGVGAQCRTGNSPNFNVLYDRTTSTFTIALLSEPLSEVRRDAERFLADTLGIQPSQLCALKYYIGTTYLVNEQYAGDSLGFSMCPGAVKLPQ